MNDEEILITSEYTLEGWLRKRSHDMFNRLQRRYFVLNGQTKTLVYYEDKTKLVEKGKFTFTNIAECTSLDKGNEFVLNASISLNALGNSTNLHMVAGDDTLKGKWIDYINKAIYGDKFDYVPFDESLQALEYETAMEECDICSCFWDSNDDCVVYLQSLVQDWLGLEPRSCIIDEHCCSNICENDYLIECRNFLGLEPAPRNSVYDRRSRLTSVVTNRVSDLPRTKEMEDIIVNMSNKVRRFDTSTVPVLVGTIKNATLADKRVSACKSLLTLLYEDESDATKESVVEFGCIDALVDILIAKENAPMIENAARVLWAVTYDCQKNQVIVGRSRAISALIDLFFSENNKMVREAVAGALYSISWIKSNRVTMDSYAKNFSEKKSVLFLQRHGMSTLIETSALIFNMVNELQTRLEIPDVKLYLLLTGLERKILGECIATMKRKSPSPCRNAPNNVAKDTASFFLAKFVGIHTEKEVGENFKALNVDSDQMKQIASLCKGKVKDRINKVVKILDELSSEGEQKKK